MSTLPASAAWRAPVAVVRPTVRAAADDWPRTGRLLPWSLAGFLVLLFLVPFDAVELPVALPLDAKVDRPALMAILALWVVALATLPRSTRPRLTLGRIHAAAAVFFAVSVASVALNAGTLANLDELGLSVKKLAVLASQMLLLVVVASAVRPAEVPRFIALMVALGAVASVGAVLEYRTDVNVFYDASLLALPGGVAVPPDLYGVDYVGRQTVYGATGHPLELATSLALVLPFAIVGVVGAGMGGRRLAWAVGLGLVVAGIMATERKTGLIAGAAAGVVLLAYRPQTVRRLLPLALGLMLVLHLLAPGAMGSLRQQLTPSHLFGVLSTRDRQSDYLAVAPDVATNPAFGRGFGSYEPYKYRIIDNQYLSLAVATGAVGVAAFLALMGACWSAGWTAMRRAGPRAGMGLGCICAVAGMAVASGLFDVLAFPHVMYTFFFLAGLAAVLVRRDEAASPVRVAGPGTGSRFSIK